MTLFQLRPRNIIFPDDRIFNWISESKHFFVDILKYIGCSHMAWRTHPLRFFLHYSTDINCQQNLSSRKISGVTLTASTANIFSLWHKNDRRPCLNGLFPTGVSKIKNQGANQWKSVVPRATVKIDLQEWGEGGKNILFGNFCSDCFFIQFLPSFLVTVGCS